MVSGCKHRYPNVEMILAHSGGTTIALAPRVAILSRHMGCALTADEILQDFRTFYYETALSAYEPTLLALEAFVHPSRILFGTDFPGQSISQVFTLHLLTLPLYTQPLAHRWQIGIRIICANFMPTIVKS